MALALFDRVQETTTTTGTGSLALAGAVSGFQSFAVVGNTNTCYYTIVDGSAWEVGIGTYSTTGPTLARTTILSNSLGNTSPITLTSGSKQVFLTYPAEKSVNLDASGNVSPLGTVSSGAWQGTTVGVAYGGTGVTASSGANSVMIRDANQNVSVNRLNQANTQTTATGGTTTLTAASTYSQTLKNTGSQIYQMPDATTLSTGVAFIFNNNATGLLTLQDYAAGAIGTITSGGAAELVLLDNSAVGGTWDVHGFLPEAVTWGTNALDLGTTIVTGGTWNGGTVQSGYGGTGLTTFAGANNALYSTGASTLTAGTLPAAAGGTGLSSFTLNGIPYANTTTTLATGSALSFDGNNLLVGTAITPTGTGKISTPSGYTAPDNAAGVGTTLNILGSTGTGQASATGGNGFVQIIGAGATSPWTFFAGGSSRRRGGILLQAGLAAADAGATYYSGSTINILGSSGTNNGTTTGLGSQIVITAGGSVAPTGTNNGGSVLLQNSFPTVGGGISISGGGANATSANGGSASLQGGLSNSGAGGPVNLQGGISNSGAGGTANLQGGGSNNGAGGNLTIKAGYSTGVAGANVTIASGFGTANGKIGFTIGALGEVVQIGPTGAIGLSGANYGTAGQVLTSGGSSAVPTWATPGGSPATSTTLGTVYGYTDSANSNLSLGYNAGTNAQGSNSIAIGKASGTNNQGSNSIAIGTNAADNDQGSNSVAVGENAGRFSQIGRSVAIGAYAGLDSQGFGSIAIGYSSGSSSQNEGAIAIGNSSGAFSTTTGQGQGLNSIAIGNNAGNTLSLPYSQAAYSTVLNATGVEFSAQNTGLYVKPVRTSVAAVGTQWNLIWDDNTGEISATPGAPPVAPSWYSYEVSTGSDVSVALPSGWDPAVSQLGYLWTFTSSGGSPYQPTPPFAWSNQGNYTYFFRVFQSNFGHAPPYPEFLDPTNFDFSSSPAIYTMLYINPTADGKSNIYVYYPPNSPISEFGSGQFSASGFPLMGSDQVGHSVIQMVGDFSNSSTYVVPSSTGTLDDVVYEPGSDKTVFFISHTAAQLPQVQTGTPILATTSSLFYGTMTFWYSYN